MLYLHGGAILPVGLPYNHVGESKLQDELTLFVALDKDGTFFLPLLTKRKPWSSRADLSVTRGSTDPWILKNSIFRFKFC
jgi:hypothetical protein